MEVGNNIVSVMQCDIKGPVSQNHTRESTKSKQHNKTQGPELAWLAGGGTAE